MLAKSSLFLFTVWLASFFAAAQSPVPVTTTIGGSPGTVPVFSGSSNNIENSSSPIFVNNGSVGIGTSSPGWSLDVWSNLQYISRFYRPNGNASILIQSADSGTADIEFQNSIESWQAGALTYGVVGFNISHDSGSDRHIHFSIQGGASDGAVGLGGNITDANLDGATMVVGGTGNVGIGTTTPGAKLEINGNLRFTGDAAGVYQTTAWTGVLCGGDYAEAMSPLGGKVKYQPGDVLVLADGDKSDVQKSTKPYSTMVAGIYATKPGVIGRRQELLKSTDDIPMAMVGVVPTKVTAQNGPIHKGDLLVTSSTPGLAMKGTDRTRMLGAVIGKAMGTLDKGTGVIQVLVTLQ